MSDSPPGISAAPNEENLRHFDVSVSGPESSPYEGTSMSYRDIEYTGRGLTGQEVYSSSSCIYRRNTL